MKYSGSWAWGSRCYEQLKVVDDMNDSGSWAQATRFYDYLKVVENMNNPMP